MIDLWLEEIKNYRDWFESEKFIRADLAKKPFDGSDEAQYGLEGTFRKLGID